MLAAEHANNYRAVTNIILGETNGERCGRLAANILGHN